MATYISPDITPGQAARAQAGQRDTAPAPSAPVPAPRLAVMVTLSYAAILFVAVMLVHGYLDASRPPSPVERSGNVSITTRVFPAGEFPIRNRAIHRL